MFVKYFKYHLLKRKIKDPEIKLLFEELTSNEYQNWNNRYFYDLNYVIDNGYGILKGYTKIFLLGLPDIWILLLNDKNFLYVSSLPSYFKLFLLI